METTGDLYIPPERKTVPLVEVVATNRASTQTLRFCEDRGVYRDGDFPTYHMNNPKTGLLESRILRFAGFTYADQVPPMPTIPGKQMRVPLRMDPTTLPTLITDPYEMAKRYSEELQKPETERQQFKIMFELEKHDDVPGNIMAATVLGVTVLRPHSQDEGRFSSYGPQ